MSEPPAVYDADPVVDARSVASLAAWIQYQALQCRGLALDLEVAAGHAAMSGQADNVDAMVGIRATAEALANRSVAIARRCRAGKGTR
jgi:hypothetical protein